ncbi:MAG TPA: carboxypeptidase M32 [Candidatus Glassbacteria bacterium]|nr:carboxypeptidase M32 [Candidatus Glassbacteria bacterium]
MITARKSYDRLCSLIRETVLLESVSALMQWDQETYMPAAGVDTRAEQLAMLARLAHEKYTEPVVGELLAECEAAGLGADSESAEAVNLREVRRKYDRKTRVPDRLVEELARTTAKAHAAWVEARRKSDFNHFRPWLEKVVALCREKAEAYATGDTLYDALLDEYEVGEREKSLTELFATLAEGISGLLGKIKHAPLRHDTSIVSRGFPVDKQKEFGRRLAAEMGFDFSAGRLDEVVHPFCMRIGPGDTRITSRFDPYHFGEGFFGILHETGHALYEQGLPAEHFGSALGESVSLGIHESQSRMWENLVGRSRPFWEYCFPIAQDYFTSVLQDVTLEAFLAAINEVKPSFIRVDADEITYNLHIILRFEIERELLSGSLPVKELPAAWNRRFFELTGLEVPDDSQGCLQDIHWAWGAIGYFPTYTLGNVYAAQIFEAAGKAIPDLAGTIARGEFKVLLNWLRENIHVHGMKYLPRELIKRVTGSDPDTGPLLTYLENKFSALYRL